MMIRTRLQGDTPFFPNMLNNGNIEVCLKEDVDKVITERDREIALLKERICNGDVSRLTWIDDCIAKDKVIAELEDKLQAANEQTENLINSASSIMLFQDRVKDNTYAELRHQKYKRCLAMAKWCIAKSLVSDYEKDETRMQWWAKWHKNWSSLADKFKEANNA